MAAATSTELQQTAADKTGVRRTVDRVKRAWAEIDYAQRRMFEIRTGVPVTSRKERTRPAPSVDELESLWELERPAA